MYIGDTIPVKKGLDLRAKPSRIELVDCPPTRPETSAHKSLLSRSITKLSSMPSLPIHRWWRGLHSTTLITDTSVKWRPKASPYFLYSSCLTLCKTDISLRQTIGTCPKGDRFRKTVDCTMAHPKSHPVVTLTIIKNKIELKLQNLILKKCPLILGHRTHSISHITIFCYLQLKSCNFFSGVPY